MITSTSNPKIQYIRSLLTKRTNREENGVFVLEGIRLVEEVKLSKLIPTLIAYSKKLSTRGMKLVTHFMKKRVECEEISENVLNSLSDTDTTQGILAIIPIPKLPFPENPNFLLIVDEIRDPGNLGTIFRSCLSAGVEGVIVTPGTADAYSPKVVRSGMGSQLSLPIRTMAWNEIDKQFHQDRKIPLRFFYTTSKEGDPYWQKDLRDPLALIIGGEAEGVSTDAKQIADEAIQIPMPGKTESLNAAVAAGILLFEVVRQRSK